MRSRPTLQLIHITGLALGAILHGCSSITSAPDEPLAEAIPLTPGVTLTGSWAEKQQTSQIQTAGVQTELSAFERQSQELDRRIKALRRQSRELERLKTEIKEIIESAPQAP